MRLNYSGICLLFLLSFFALSVYGQVTIDKVILLNGKEITGQITSVKESEIDLTTTKKNGKEKQSIVENYRIFSYVIGNEETVLYQQDTLIGNYLTEEEMRYFILGQQDASNGFKTTSFGIGAGVVGTAFIILNSQDPENEGSFDSEPSGLFPVVYPFIAITIARYTPVRIRLETVSDPAYLSQEYYIVGYERTARVKKVFSALKGSVVGIAVGLGTYYILRP